MADIMHPTGKGDFPYRHIRIFQKFFGISDSGVDKVVLDSKAHITFKFPGKVVFAYMLEGGKIFQKKILLKMSVYIFGASLYMGRDIRKGWTAGKIQDKQPCEQIQD